MLSHLSLQLVFPFLTPSRFIIRSGYHYEISVRVSQRPPLFSACRLQTDSFLPAGRHRGSICALAGSVSQQYVLKRFLVFLCSAPVFDRNAPKAVSLAQVLTSFKWLRSGSHAFLALFVLFNRHTYSYR